MDCSRKEGKTMAREKKLHSKKKNERYFMIRLYIVMTFIMVITLYPMWYSVINSLNSAADLSKNGYAYLLPRDLHWIVGKQL